MRTLDEVINAFEKADVRWSNDPHNPLEYPDFCDAFHYLKAFRDAKNALDAERERAIESYCQWKDAREKLEAQTSQMMWVDNHFQFEISDNPPLTWDELKQMEGKPVWVECEYYPSRWAIITGVYDCKISIVGNRLLDSELKDEQGEIWQAYRKERENES